jgi:hypothetical protein
MRINEQINDFFTNSLGKEATDDMITAMIMTYQEGVPTVPNLVPETLLASEYRGISFMNLVWLSVVCYHNRIDFR